MQGRRNIEGVCGEQGGGDRREVGWKQPDLGTGALEGRGCQEKFAPCVGKGRLNPSLPDSFTCNVLNAVNRPVWERTEAENSMARSRRSQYIISSPARPRPRPRPGRSTVCVSESDLTPTAVRGPGAEGTSANKSPPRGCLQLSREWSVWYRLWNSLYFYF